MPINNETYDRIDRYLLNQMEVDEKELFEQEIAIDSELEMEVLSQRELINLMEENDQYEKLQIKLNGFHENINMDEARKAITEPRSTRKKDTIRLLVNMVVAASVSLIVVFSSLKYAGIFDSQEGSFKELMSPEIENLKNWREEIDEWRKSQNINNNKVEVLPKSFGTSFVLSPNGYLVTNYHVVKNVDSIYISHRIDTVTRYKAKIVFKDERNDLAVLMVDDKNFKSFGKIPYTFSTKESGLSEYVFTLDYSKGDIVFGEGAISSLTGYQGDTNSYQISIPANPGTSGAPLIDDNGRIKGIVVGKNIKKEGAAFAIRSDYLMSIVDSLKNDTSFEAPKLPTNNKISWMKRSEQIQKLLPFVFKVEVYKD